jgi:hypothetical protein
MAKVPLTYLGPGPVSVEIASNITPRSVAGALFFWPEYTKYVTEAELDFIQTGPVTSSRYVFGLRAVYGGDRQGLIMDPDEEEGPGKRGEEAEVIETDGLESVGDFGYVAVTVEEE